MQKEYGDVVSLKSGTLVILRIVHKPIHELFGRKWPMCTYVVPTILQEKTSNCGKYRNLSKNRPAFFTILHMNILLPLGQRMRKLLTPWTFVSYSVLFCGKYLYVIYVETIWNTQLADLQWIYVNMLHELTHLNDTCNSCP